MKLARIICKILGLCPDSLAHNFITLNPWCPHQNGGFHGHGGTPQQLAGFCEGKSQPKMDDLGVYPHFKKPPNSSCLWIFPQSAMKGSITQRISARNAMELGVVAHLGGQFAMRQGLGKCGQLDSEE